MLNMCRPAGHRFSGPNPKGDELRQVIGGAGDQV